MGSRGGSIGNSKVPKGWHITGFFEGIAILRPNNPNQSLSLPRESELPGVSYLLYKKDGTFKQLRIFGSDNKPTMDIDYHMKDGEMSLHKHIYINGVRQKEHIDLTTEEFDKYKKFVEKVIEE